VSKFFLKISSRRNLENYSGTKRHFIGSFAFLSFTDVNPISMFIHPFEEILHSRNDGRRGKRAETASGNCSAFARGETFFASG
jgi:hypothetical protein